MIPLDPTNKKRLAYEMAWLAYLLFTILAFPLFSITVLLFSMALSIAGAWLYGYRGWLITTLLTIPYHYILLRFHSDDPAIWNTAFNPIAISIQAGLSGAVAWIRSKDVRLKALNTVLESRVKERGQALEQIRLYIIENTESEREILAHSILYEIDTSLISMLKQCADIEAHLARKEIPFPAQLPTMSQLINDSISSIHQMEFMDDFTQANPDGLEQALLKLTAHYNSTAGTVFEVNIEKEIGTIPRNTSRHIYRIAREAITNAIKHAQSTRITIDLFTNESALQLCITNDGQPMKQMNREGMGIKLMQQRAKILKGTICYEAHTDGGTKFSCTIPTISFKNA